MQDEKILIDRNTLKAISSDTRFNILKLLNKKIYTLSELSEKLDLKKSTITEHLKHLIDAGLIIKKEDKRKWKYYSLSDKGKHLLQPKAITVYLAFIISLFASFSLITYFLYNFFNNSISKIFLSKPLADKAMANTSNILNNTTEAIKSTAPTVTSKTINVTSTNLSSSITLINKILIALIIIFVITTIVFFIIYLKKRKNYIKVI